MVGDLLFRNVEADKSTNTALPDGTWCLSPRSTVPFVRLSSPTQGERTITWGETVPIEDGPVSVVVANVSAHRGDVVLSNLGRGGFPARAPGRITVPALFTADGQVLRSQWLDTRTARRAFLALAGQASYQKTYTVRHRQDRTSTELAAGSPMVSGGSAPLAAYNLTPQTFGQMVPLGIGAGDVLDTLARSLAEVRPHALLDAVQVQVAAADFNPAWPDCLAFFVLEY